MEFEAAVAAPLHIVTQHTFAPGTPAGACSLFNYSCYIREETKPHLGALSCLPYASFHPQELPDSFRSL